MGEPDYVVIRASADLPEGFLPPGLDGRWYNRAEMLRSTPSEYVARTFPGAVAVPAGRFEVRGDGMVAEVWEVRP